MHSTDADVRPEGAADNSCVMAGESGPELFPVDLHWLGGCAQNSPVYPVYRIRPQGEEVARHIPVNKRTHRIRFEGETEDAVTVIIEKL